MQYQGSPAAPCLHSGAHPPHLKEGQVLVHAHAAQLVRPRHLDRLRHHLGAGRGGERRGESASTARWLGARESSRHACAQRPSATTSLQHKVGAVRRGHERLNLAGRQDVLCGGRQDRAAGGARCGLWAGCGRRTVLPCPANGDPSCLPPGSPPPPSAGPCSLAGAPSAPAGRSPGGGQVHRQAKHSRRACCGCLLSLLGADPCLPLHPCTFGKAMVQRASTSLSATSSSRKNTSDCAAGGATQQRRPGVNDVQAPQAATSTACATVTGTPATRAHLAHHVARAVDHATPQLAPLPPPVVRGVGAAGR